MKRTVLISILFLGIYLSACKKSLERHSVDFNVIGQWIYTENAIGIGPPGVWKPAEPPNEIIEFKTGGIFVSAPDFLTGATNYEVVDSISLKIMPVTTLNGYIKMHYKIDAVNGKLTLQPVEPLCIEGCDYRFVRK